MELAGESVHVFREADQLRAHLAKLAVAVRRWIELFLELRGVDGKDRQPLGPVVVHLPGDPSALILLSLQEPSGQRPEFVLGLSKRLLAGMHVLIRGLRARALAKISPMVRRRCTSSSGQVRNSRNDPKLSAPRTMPPAFRGIVRWDLIPIFMTYARSLTASGGVSSGSRSKRISSPRRIRSAYHGRSACRTNGGSGGYPGTTNECVARIPLLSSDI